MTLQEIADYAMDYLDSKGISAEYEITTDNVKVYFNESLCWLNKNESKGSIEAWLDAFI